MYRTISKCKVITDRKYTCKQYNITSCNIIYTNNIFNSASAGRKKNTYRGVCRNNFVASIMCMK